mgnify:FL=1
MSEYRVARAHYKLELPPEPRRLPLPRWFPIQQCNVCSRLYWRGRRRRYEMQLCRRCQQVVDKTRDRLRSSFFTSLN